jgi:hypothetical protein
MAAPPFRVIAVEIFERPVRLRIPFRFGAATVEEAGQAFVRARIRVADAREAEGAAAELMIPKWFDKSPARSNADNIVDLRCALAAAANAYTSHTDCLSAFGHAALHYTALIGEGARRGLNPLTASYGPALVDRAVLDALLRALGLSFAAGVRCNLPGIDATLTPDLARFDIDRFLAKASEPTAIAARHTVGMLDPIAASDMHARVGDGLPETLEEVIATYGNRYFKLKLGGDAEADAARLVRIATILDRLPSYAITLDGNEQYRDPAAIEELWQRVQATPALARLFAATLYLEQPLPRPIALDVDVSALRDGKPLLIDESDATLDAFREARTHGYSGVSSKSCKGIYKSLLNAARCAQWNAEEGGSRYFLSGEDLTAQAGLAVQQDLALVAVLGLTHVERNGHHYVDRFKGQGATPTEADRFLAAHPHLYREHQGAVGLAIREGEIDLSFLRAPGFASLAQPDWTTMKPLVARDATSNASAASVPSRAIQP